jgi:DNA-binding MarR family transcriptional regulator
MQRTIPESAWKILRRVHALAVERFCERVLAEIESVVHRGESGHQRYLDVFQVVQQRDREMARIFEIRSAPTPEELAQRLGITKQAMSQFIRELQTRGYVEQVPDPSDTRAKLVRLTKRGIALRASCHQMRAATTEVALRALGPAS